MASCTRPYALSPLIVMPCSGESANRCAVIGRDEWAAQPHPAVLVITQRGVVRVRIVVSAPNAGALFDLRCAVREGLVDWVQHRGVLPTQRIEAAESATEPQPRRDDAGETKRLASGMFSGSPEAEARARAFDEHADYEDEFARSSNGNS